MQLIRKTQLQNLWAAHIKKPKQADKDEVNPHNIIKNTWVDQYNYPSN